MRIEYTQEMIDELMRCQDDPVYFINHYCFIEDVSLGVIPFKLYDFQEAAVRSLQENRFTVMMQGRQTGKTVVLGLYALWSAIFKPYQSILLGSVTRRAADDMLSRIKFTFEHLPIWMKHKVMYNNRYTLEFCNGSRIQTEALTEYIGRGRMCSLIILDEFAFVRRNLQEAVLDSIIPCMSVTRGQFIIASTPGVERGKFEEIWSDAIMGKNTFKPFFASSREVPGHDSQWQERMTAILGKDKFEQEYQVKLS